MIGVDILKALTINSVFYYELNQQAELAILLQTLTIDIKAINTLPEFLYIRVHKIIIASGRSVMP